MPNSSRSDPASELTGFHSANVFSGSGSVLVGTKVLAMNVIGKIAENAKPWTPSGVLRMLPMRIPTQIIANEKPTIRP